MGGASSLRGLAGYQQRYVTVRVLGALGLRALAENKTEPVLTEFSIEGQTSDDAPSWDARFAFSDGSVELNECKDTQITRPDRLAFYDRLRKEVASGTTANIIRPVWVTDPGKQTKNALKHLGGIAAAVKDLDLASVEKALPRAMDSLNDAIKEAVYRLCHYTGEEPKEGEKRKELPRPCSFEEAKSLLLQLRIACHRFEELDQSVKLLTTGLFTRGTAEAIYKYITGELTEGIVKRREARFTPDGFVQAVGTMAIGLDVEGRVRNLLSFRAASGFLQRIRLVQWAGLPDQPITRWTLAERVPEYALGQSCLVVAAMGVGKTVASQMAFEEEAGRQHPSRVLRVEARTLDGQDLDAVVRLACMLCGVGPTWLAIDGLDEIPHVLRMPWERALGELAVLPDLTLFVTVRREVLAVREWLANAAAPLARIEMHPLGPGQVKAAFAGVGLPEPTNARLVEALQNPFLLSLYANIVTSHDMPLAESGEVTAFRVVDEFWKRRVRGVSEGQRAVGTSEVSQEPKRQAALLLSDRTLAGDLAVTRGSDNPQIVSGIEMLLREGVIREQGAGAVAWIHEWIREYALIDRLLSWCENASAVALARQIMTRCEIDHVARSAAAGGMKWVVASPAGGKPIEFLSELWASHQGLAREALAVLLEGSPSGAPLGDLGDDILVEAVTLAIHLGARQWGGEVARVADDRFFGRVGDRLHVACVEYELKVAPGVGEPALETVRRLVDRDHRRWLSGRLPLLGTVATVLEKVVVTGAFQDASVQSWLVAVAGCADQYSFGKVRDAIASIIATGEVDTALTMFRALAGLTNPARGDEIAKAVVRRRFVYENDLIGFFSPSLIATNLESWGETAIHFLAKLLEAKQAIDWPSTLRFMRAMAEAPGSTIDEGSEFALDFDHEPRITTLGQDNDDPIVRVAGVLSEAMKEVASHDHPRDFRQLTDLAMRTRFAAVVVLPLLVMCDSTRGAIPRKGWHVPETVRLLSDGTVAALESLHDVRRILRIGLPDTLSQSDRHSILLAIRQADVIDLVRMRELSDVQNWGVLTPEEVDQITVAATAGEIDEPVDPRTESLFSLDRNPPPESSERGTGWPYPEDESFVQLLQRCVTESDVPVAGGPQLTALDQQLQALGVVMGRAEALGDEWVSHSIGWGHRAIQSLRRTAEIEDADENGPLDSATWCETLDRNAPWWRKMTDAAIARLADPVPESHAKKEIKESRLSWMSNDPVLHALELIDDVLAIAPAPQFDAMQTRLIDTITAKWAGWPPFTRASALSCLRPWYWCAFLAMRTLLSETVKQESNPLVLRYAIDRLVDLAWTKPTPEIPEFVRRAAAGGHAESLRRISQVLGEAVARKSLPTPSSRAIDLESYYRQCLAMEWPDAEAHSDFLEGALCGIVDCGQNADAEPDEVKQAWPKEVDLVVARWPFDALNATGHEQFPVHVLLRIFKDGAPADERARLFVGLCGTFERILRSGDLAAFCSLHHELKGLIAGAYRSVRGGRERQDGLPMSEVVEDNLHVLSRASVERVAAWKKEGKTTNDHGWMSGLDGRDSSELVKCCLDASRDQSRMKRLLMPLPDILADAGNLRVAAELRAYLRKA